MKKLMLLLFVVLLVGTVTAFEFDNKLSYSEDNLKVDLINWWGLGKDYGSAMLQSHPSVNYIKMVAPGSPVVMWYDFNFLELYKNGLGNVEFIDERTGKQIDRNYSFVYWGDKERNVYGEGNCNVSVNGTRDCEIIVVGNETYKEWIPYNSRDIPKGDIRIGIKVDVKVDDYVDGVWTIGGKKVSRHAVWTADLNVDIIAFYKMNDTAGDVIDSTGNFSSNDFILTRGAVGIINFSYTFNAVSSYIANNSILTGDDWSISVWFHSGSACTGTDYLFDSNVGGSDRNSIRCNPGANLECIIFNEVKTVTAWANVDDDVWHQVICVANDTNVQGYLDGVSVFNTTTASGSNIGSSVRIGDHNSGAGTLNFDGELDELGIWNRALTGSEAIQLWNGGAAISFMEMAAIAPNVTLISPANDTNFTVSNVVFNVTVTDDIQVQNVTLFIDGVLNETNSSGFNGTYIFTKTFVDGIHNWSIGAEDDIALITNSSTRIFTIDTIIPAVIINSPIGRQSIIRIGDNETVTWNITDLNLDTCLLDYNGVNTTLNCAANTTGFLYVNGVNNLSIFANDTIGNSNTTTTTWDYNITQINQSFNSPVFTTSTQTFTVNLTVNSDFTAPTSPSIIHNGTTTTGGTVISTGGNNFTLSQTIDIPDLVNGTSDWLFSFTMNSTLFNSSVLQQTIIRLDLVNCNTTPFINFTFKNETLAEEDVNATFDSIWNYFIGSGSVQRTLSFTNATENPFYGFCLNAANDTLFTLVNVSYANSISQQRQFRPTLLTLTNTTTNRILYLLPTVDGLFNTFRTENTLGNTIVGARGAITRTLGGNPITSAIDITDGSGIVIFFLDPDITYTATFSASGFLNNVFTFVPTTDLRIVIMGSTAALGNGTNISIGMNYTIEPPNTTLNNGTDITFRFIVSEGSEPVTFIGFNISNDTTTLLLVNQTSDGTISGILNTRDNSSFTGVFTISTINETLTITKIWRIEQSFIGDYSIFRQFNLYMDYDFKDFIRLLLVIATLAAVMIFMSREIGIDEEVKMAVAILIVWAFSIVGWLDTGIAINSSSANINNLSQFSNQYGIAIVSTIAAAYFILRRVFRQI